MGNRSPSALAAARMRASGSRPWMVGTRCSISGTGRSRSRSGRPPARPRTPRTPRRDPPSQLLRRNLDPGDGAGGGGSPGFCHQRRHGRRPGFRRGRTRMRRGGRCGQLRGGRLDEHGRRNLGAGPGVRRNRHRLLIPTERTHDWHARRRRGHAGDRGDRICGTAGPGGRHLVLARRSDVGAHRSRRPGLRPRQRRDLGRPSVRRRGRGSERAEGLEGPRQSHGPGRRLDLGRRPEVDPGSAHQDPRRRRVHRHDGGPNHGWHAGRDHKGSAGLVAVGSVCGTTPGTASPQPGPRPTVSPGSA